MLCRAKLEHLETVKICETQRFFYFIFKCYRISQRICSYCKRSHFMVKYNHIENDLITVDEGLMI